MKSYLKKTIQMIPCSACPNRERDMFQVLSSEQLEQVEHYRGGQCAIAAKTHLYQQGEKHNNVYTLFAGWVMLYKTLSNGGRQVLRYALPGDILNFQSDPEAPMTHSAVTLTNTTLCSFARPNFYSILEENPNVTLQLAQIMAEDVALSHEYLINIGRKNARERMAFLFLELYHRLKVQAPDIGNTMPFPMTQEDIADTLGLTLVHVNRTLRSLRQEELIQLSHHKLTIMKYKELAIIAGFNLNELKRQALL